MSADLIAVQAALDTVLDPELDAPLTELGFIASLEVAGGAVRVALRLPTFWCSANFAYIMGEDVIAAVGALPFVERVEVALLDHFAARRVNGGLARGLTFGEAFDTEAAGDLTDVRAAFADKAYLSRQATVLQALRREAPAEIIVSTTLTALQERAATAGPAHAHQIIRYLEARHRREPSPGAEHLAFITLEGDAIAADGLLDHLRAGRRISGSMEANGEMCRMLLAARTGPDAPPGALDQTETAERS